jgi:succinoglycan biosynthesis transport protein ExoP
MDLEQYVRLLRERWLFIASTVLVFTVAAGLLAWTRTPMYAARTQLFVSTGNVNADPTQAYQGGLFSQQRVLSYAQIVDSPAVTSGVISTLGLSTTPEDLGRQISAEAPLDTVLINVTVKDTSPQRAKAIADAVGERFPSFVETLETRPGDPNSPVKVSITRRPELPLDPVSPRKELYLALGVLVGLVFGIGGAALRQALS